MKFLKSSYWNKRTIVILVTNAIVVDIRITFITHLVTC